MLLAQDDFSISIIDREKLEVLFQIPVERANDAMFTPDGKKVYDSTCTACHAAGVANAPKLGDKAAWAPRVKQGMDALVQSATKGKGAMPPKGGNTSLSDADLRAAIEYMVSQAK